MYSQNENNSRSGNLSDDFAKNNHKTKKHHNNLKKNYFYNLIYQIFLVIVPLIVTPYISRVLTPDGIGKYSFSYSIINYFLIFGSLGFGYYAQREIAKYQNDIENQSKIFWEIILCRLIPVFISVVINSLLCALYIYKDYTQLMLIFNINLLALVFDIAFFYQGKEEFGKLVIRNLLIKSISIVLIFLFVKNQNHLLIYALINSISVLTSAFSMWILIHKYLVKIKIRKLKPLRHFKGTLILFLPTIAVSVYMILDKTLIGLLIKDTYTVFDEDGNEIIKKVSDLENGYYEQSEKIVKLVMTVITSIGTVMIPRNSKEFAEGNLSNVNKNIAFSSSLVLLLGIPLTLGMISLADMFVPWFFGEGYDKCIILIRIMAPLIIIIGFSNVFGLQYLIPLGKDKLFTFSVVSGALINFTLNVFFIKAWWSIGAAIATIIAEFVVTIIMSIMVRNSINFIKILIGGWKYYIAGGIMFILIHFLKTKFSPTIINTFILAFIGGLTYFIILFIFKEKILLNILNKILKK